MDLSGSLDECLLTSRGLEVISEESSAFSDDGGSLLVLTDLLLEFSSFLLTFVVQSSKLEIQILELLTLLIDDGCDDFSSGVEIALELGFILDSLGVALSEVFVIGGDVDIAGSLVVIMSGVIFLLFSGITIFQVGEGAKETIKWLLSLKLEVNGVE